MAYKEYKIWHIAKGGIEAILLGASQISLKQMETVLNQAAAERWSVVFQVLEKKRFILFWQREAVIITLGR